MGSTPKEKNLLIGEQILSYPVRLNPPSKIKGSKKKKKKRAEFLPLEVYLFLVYFQFCCKGGMFNIFSKVSFTDNQSDGHLECRMPQYVFLSCIMGYLSVSVFLKLSAGIKLLLMIIMGAVYIVVMEITHSEIFDEFDAIHK